MKNPFNHKRNGGIGKFADAYARARPRPTASKSDIALTKILDDVTQHYRGRQLMRSNSLTNGLSGAGGCADKSGFFDFMPFWLNSQQTVENMCIQSWAADRFVRMPIDDMFSQPRQYEDDAFSDEAERLKIDAKLNQAMVTGRKYGTGLLWVVSKEMPPEMPLNVARIRPEDIVNLLVLSRYDVSVTSRYTDIQSPNLGEPEMYQIHVHQTGTFNVHASRVYRFDGMKPDTSNGWINYERDWGVSSLAHAMTEIFNDASVVQAVNHLVQEASIPVQKVQGLQDILCSQPVDDEMSVQERMEVVNAFKSIYRTLLMDSNDTFERVGVTFSGLPDLLEKMSERLAMMAGVSATRFLGTSPDGENSTGDGDMRNDNRTTSVRQHNLLRPAYKWLDELVAASAGTTVPDYTFPPLYEPTQSELAEVEETRSKTATSMVACATWTEDEAKEYLATGILPTGPVEVEEEDDEEVTREMLAREKAKEELDA